MIKTEPESDMRIFKDYKVICDNQGRIIFRLLISTPLLLLSILSISFNGITQTFCGQLMDKKGESIPYVKVINHTNKKGVYSDVDGKFCIDYMSNSDSIIFYSNEEFETITYLVKDLKPDKILLLKDEKVTQLETFSIVAPKLFILNEFPFEGSASLSLEAGGNYCSYIDGSENYTGRIKSVSFYLNNFSADYNIIPALYEYDIISKSVGRKISIRNYQLDSLKEHQWHEIKIFDTIYAPKNGFCVGFECIPKNNKIDLNEKNKKPSLSFGAYYQKVKDGDRTYFSSFLKSDEWFQFPRGSYDSKHLLNLAVKVDVLGEEIHYKNNSIQLVKERKVYKILKSETYPTDLTLKQHTIEELFQSVIKIIELNDITLFRNISKLRQEDYEEFQSFVNDTPRNWLTREEQNELLIIWTKHLNSITSENVTKIEEGYYKIQFSDENQLEEFELFKVKDKWYLNPYSKRILKK